MFDRKTGGIFKFLLGTSQENSEQDKWEWLLENFWKKSSIWEVAVSGLQSSVSAAQLLF